jgi:UDP-N-acetylglucosamine 4-epimerase
LGQHPVFIYQGAGQAVHFNVSEVFQLNASRQEFSYTFLPGLDFTFVENVVQANLLAATTNNRDAVNEAYNIAIGQCTTLNELLDLLKRALHAHDPAVMDQKPIYREFRPGDVRHSLANINKARSLLGYEPEFPIELGLELAMDWYRAQIKSAVTAK